MIVSNVNAVAEFAADRFQAVTLAQSPRSKTMIVGLEAGQAIPIHHPGSDLTLLVLSGDATLVSAHEEIAHAGQGALLHAAAGEARGIRANQRTVAVVVVSPPPTEADHREIAAHMQRGTWR